MYPLDIMKTYDGTSGPTYDRIRVALDAMLDRGKPDPRFLTVED